MQLYNTGERKVQCSPDFESRGIHCLMDMLIIDDADVANVLIDMVGIELILLIREESDARKLLSDSSRVPLNCKNAITKGGNTYYPDPNYRSYSGKNPKNQLLQTSVEDVVRYVCVLIPFICFYSHMYFRISSNLQEEIENLESDEEKSKQIVQDLDKKVQQNETKLRTEENNLVSNRNELNRVREEKRAMEAEIEPEPADVIAMVWYRLCFRFIL